MHYLSVDVGTTCCKCQLFSDSGEILEYYAEEYEFRREGEDLYVAVDVVWEKLKAAIGRIAAKNTIDSICVSSLGESFVLLDDADNVLVYPMLYTDPRGEKETEEIKKIYGEERAFATTGTIPHSMYSISKLLWIKKERPELFAKADKALLICDYIGYLLTGERVIDYGLAARTGAFNVKNLAFETSLLQALEIPTTFFSTPKRAGSIVGKIKKALLQEWNLSNEPLLVLGSHDQICATLGAGALEEGDSVDGMGTVECITTLFTCDSLDVEMGRQGYPCVPYAVEGLYCTYALNYSCGSTVNWLRKKIMHGYKGEEQDFFAYIEKGITDEPTGILALPYFGGAATPYQDLSAKGAILNLTTETTDSMLYQGLMEGTAMEMRLNMETLEGYGIFVKNTVATGGGANSDKWLQIKANVQNIPIKTLRSSEGGLCGCAILQALALGGAKDWKDAAKIFVQYAKAFAPKEEKCAAYARQYENYKKIYKTTKEILSI